MKEGHPVHEHRGVFFSVYNIFSKIKSLLSVSAMPEAAKNLNI